MTDYNGLHGDTALAVITALRGLLPTYQGAAVLYTTIPPAVAPQGPVVSVFAGSSGLEPYRSRVTPVTLRIIFQAKGHTWGEAEELGNLLASKIRYMGQAADNNTVARITKAQKFSGPVTYETSDNTIQAVLYIEVTTRALPATLT